jgi:hypothetical protein
MRKFDPVSEFKRYTLSSTDPTTPPDVRKTEIVAGGNAQVGTPSEVSLNATGITPRLALKTLVPFALIGCWTCAAYLNLAIRNGLSEFTLA